MSVRQVLLVGIDRPVVSCSRGVEVGWGGRPMTLIERVMLRFVVEHVYGITDCPVITRSQEASLLAESAGDRFHLGDLIVCGELTAKIVGIESFAEPASQGALLLAGVTLEDVHPGQAWVADR